MHHRAGNQNSTPRAAWAGRGRVLLAVAAGALLAQTGGRLFAPAVAEAQQRAARAGSGILNPADQRNEMITELRKITSRLEKIEKSFSGTMDVNVLSMPANTASASLPGD